MSEATIVIGAHCARVSIPVLNKSYVVDYLANPRAGVDHATHTAKSHGVKTLRYMLAAELVEKPAKKDALIALLFRDEQGFLGESVVSLGPFRARLVGLERACPNGKAYCGTFELPDLGLVATGRIRVL